LPQIHSLGATLAAISPQTPDHSQATLLKNFLQYEVLSDLGNQVSRAYGLVYPLGETVRRLYRSNGVDLSHYNADESWEIPLPGTFIIDQNGIIRLAFVDTDIAKRLEPDVLLEVLTRLGAERTASSAD